MDSTNPQGIEAIIQLIAEHTGLYTRPQDHTMLFKKLLTRMQALRLTSLADYYQLLAASNPRSDREWQTLAVLLTTGESYLFRDQGQLTLLKNQLLPELIHHRKFRQLQEGTAKPSLRIWSAGCSTGEEAYSLAILVQELIPNLDDWDISILGTDINPQAIQKAKRGLYNSWSFRTIGSELQSQYFHKQGNDWKIHAKLQKMVSFQVGNLVKDPYPNAIAAINDMDLIICRNVFIYFNSASIARVLEKFTHTLRPQGYLMVGHAELFRQDLQGLKTKVFPESVVYQRTSEVSTAGSSSALPWGSPSNTTLSIDLYPDISSVYPALNPRSPVNLLPPHPETSLPYNTATPGSTPSAASDRNHPSTNSTPNISDPSKQLADYPTLLKQIESFLQDGAYVSAIAVGKQAIQLCANRGEAYYLIAKAYANLGQYAEAQSYCQKAMTYNAIWLSPHYLLARIAEEQNQVETAKALLKKIIYLEPRAIAAYLDLGSIYAREKNPSKAQKLWRTALDLLKELPLHQTVEHFHHVTAGDLLFQVKKLLNKS